MRQVGHSRERTIKINIYSDVIKDIIRRKEDMKKLFIGVAAVVTVGALVLTGCPDGSTGSGSGGGGNFVTPKCEVASGATSTIDLVYGDGNYTAGCTQLEPAMTDPFGSYSEKSSQSFAPITSGVNNTAEAYRLGVTDASEGWGGGFIKLNAAYNVSGKTLKFSIRSAAAGGNGSIRVYIEDISTPEGDQPTYQNDRTEGIMSFTNDGEWQEVSVDIDTVFDSIETTQADVSAATIGAVGFALEDTDNNMANGIGAQVIDIDEIRFE